MKDTLIGYENNRYLLFYNIANINRLNESDCMYQIRNTN